MKKEKVEQIDGHLYRVKRDNHGRITSRVACDPSQNGKYLVENGELTRIGSSNKVEIDVR